MRQFCEKWSLPNMARIVASVGDGHTRLGILDSKFGFRQYPIRLYLYRDGLFVQAATADYAQVVGARVIRIGGATAEQAFKTVSEITQRDNDSGLRHSVPQRLVVPEVLHALRLIDDMEKAPLVVEKQGRQFSVDLEPLDPKADVKWVHKDSFSRLFRWSSSPECSLRGVSRPLCK